jgi:hypothetical protein
LIKEGSYQTRVPASAIGKVRIDWYSGTVALAPRREIPASDLIGSGSVRSSSTKTTVATIKLTKRGLITLRTAKHVRLQMRVTFTPASGPPIVTSKPFTPSRARAVGNH